ncbi:hypothetical protein ElyMa_005873300 [Elysia marginata]|uniref:Uncharacterized protein n=1 Tax=Elysia marginata TaxID=1093978 RepID=A0AAV4G1U2_9GAST|nr:hypothetical protein ElyMa_005873300 [Elysia marginata]
MEEVATTPVTSQCSDPQRFKVCPTKIRRSQSNRTDVPQRCSSKRRKEDRKAGPSMNSRPLKRPDNLVPTQDLPQQTEGTMCKKHTAMAAMTSAHVENLLKLHSVFCKLHKQNTKTGNFEQPHKHGLADRTLGNSSSAGNDYHCTSFIHQINQVDYESKKKKNKKMTV